jgi:uncharacterized protein (AIM24 family)
MVTFRERLRVRVRKLADWKSTLFSGEGLVVGLTGPGKLTLQTRSADAFLAWLIPQLPRQRSDDDGCDVRGGIREGKWDAFYVS